MRIEITSYVTLGISHRYCVFFVHCSLRSLSVKRSTFTADEQAPCLDFAACRSTLVAQFPAELAKLSLRPDSTITYSRCTVRAATTKQH